MRATAKASTIASVVMASLLSSCTTLPPAPVDRVELQRQWRAHQQELRRISGWELTGRIAVRTPDDGWSAGVDWSQPDSGHYAIRFSGPFGQGAASLQARPGAVTLTLPERPPQTADDAQALLAAELGWDIPVEALRFWILGLPAPGVAFDPAFDNRGRLAELQQADWRIRYQRYKAVDGVSLPGKIEARSGDVRLRIVVDRWQVTTDDAGNDP